MLWFGMLLIIMMLEPLIDVVELLVVLFARLIIKLVSSIWRLGVSQYRHVVVESV